MSNSDKPTTATQRITRAPIARDLCGMAAAADLLGDRWSLLILRAVFYGVTRFDDLKRDLGVSSATLTTKIRFLIESNLLESRLYREGNARSRKEYLLTPQGIALRSVLLAMMVWADENLEKKPSPLDAISTVTGEVLRLAFVDPNGHAVDDTDVEFVLQEN